MNFDYEGRLILKILSGSHAYGTSVEGSDMDYRGILIAPKSYYLGLDTFEQYESNDPDTCYFELRKFIKLALQANPNILELLFTDEYMLLNSFGQRLVDIRDQFLTQRCAKTYMGYAMQQLKRLRVKPAPGSRTDRRMALVEQFGYDTKYAMHLIRLLKTSLEVLSEGKLLVYRPERELLLDIRNGKFTFPEIEEMSEDLVEQVRQAEEGTELPEKPDYNMVNQLVIDIVSEYFEE